jgi:hypothetical protein
MVTLAAEPSGAHFVIRALMEVIWLSSRYGLHQELLHWGMGGRMEENPVSVICSTVKSRAVWWPHTQSCNLDTREGEGSGLAIRGRQWGFESL